MSAHPPPIPPDQQPKQAGVPPEQAHAAGQGAGDKNANLAEQGCAGNLKQNTTNKGFQQDR